MLGRDRRRSQRRHGKLGAPDGSPLGGSGPAAALLQGAQGAGRNHVSISDRAAVAGRDARTKHGSGSVLTISSCGIFTKSPNANGKYLYQTRSQFANQNDLCHQQRLLCRQRADSSCIFFQCECNSSRKFARSSILRFPTDMDRHEVRLYRLKVRHLAIGHIDRRRQGISFVWDVDLSGRSKPD